MHTNQRWGKIKFTGLVKHVVLCRSCSSSSTLNCFLRQGTLRDYCIDQFSSVTPTASRCGVSLRASDPVLRPCQGGGEGGGSHVVRLNFKTSRVGVYKCLSLIVGFAVTVAVWPREVVSCRNFILLAVATFWAMLLVGIYPGRASFFNHP